ncbi:MAG: HAD-IB family phosphatase, partial [Thermoplasmata archaeon]|nr:HAD-IB family phosphatase [Thermoplasmata archaeon]
SWAEVHRFFGDSNEEGLRAFLENRIDDHEFVRSDVRIWWKHRPDLTLPEVAKILDGVPLMPGASELFQVLKARRIRTAIVSGGIDLLAERLARELGIDIVLANGLATDAAGRLTGEGVIRVPIANKELVLHELQTRLGISVAETASVGNSEIDVGLFRRSRIGIAFRPADAAVRAAATFVIESGSLTQVLERLEESS